MLTLATGKQRELDTINLFDPSCPIRYVITVQALKEGWDCSFAYVLCSVANTKSSTAVEQLLGRVLRMPYAETRTQAELNKAYAHVSAQSWTHAVTQLHDRLVSMGFEAQEAEEFLYAQPSFGFEEAASPPFEVQLVSKPDLSSLDIVERASVIIEETQHGTYTLKVEGACSVALAEKLVRATPDKKDREEIALRAKLFIKHQTANLTPSQRGEVFRIPQLCLQFEDGMELAEEEVFLPENGWNLLDYPAVLNFTVNEHATQYAVDIQGEKIVTKALDNNDQLSLEGIRTDITDIGLCLWLDKKLRERDYANGIYDIKQETRLEFLRRVVRNLLARADMDMPKLVRAKFVLEKFLSVTISAYRKEAHEKCYQTCMFGTQAIVGVDPEHFSFSFDPDNYPASTLYEGRIGFSKHYYPRIAIMNGEEAECAQAIDRNPLVKFWVRNLERQRRHAFWLQTSSDKFYPDFVAQLTDGRLLVIEYKGERDRGNSDVEEKELLGKLWAEKSGNLFLMGWKKEEGRDIYQQINQRLAG